jgi:hypothetical protein
MSSASFVPGSMDRNFRDQFRDRRVQFLHTQ